MSKPFFEGDRVVLVKCNELVYGTVKSMTSSTSIPTLLVEFDDGELIKAPIDFVAHAPTKNVTAEETDNKEAFTVMLGALAVVDKIVSAVCPVPYSEPDYE
jgi:hypothetical protein